MPTANCCRLRQARSDQKSKSVTNAGMADKSWLGATLVELAALIIIILLGPIALVALLMALPYILAVVAAVLVVALAGLAIGALFLVVYHNPQWQLPELALLIAMAALPIIVVWQLLRKSGKACKETERTELKDASRSPAAEREAKREAKRAAYREGQRAKRSMKQSGGQSEPGEVKISKARSEFRKRLMEREVAREARRAAYRAKQQAKRSRTA
jgi:hypothetical protein